MPFGGDPGMQGGQIVEALQHFAIGAVGAVAAVGPGRDHRLEAVAPGAEPPGLAVAGGGDLPGRQGAVALLVPLGGQLGIPGGQVIELGQHLLSGAHRAAASASRPGADRGAPAVAMGAAPPDLFLCAGGHVPGGQGAVAVRVPLGGQLREEGGQVVLAGQQLPARAHRAAAAGDPGLHHGAPAVALGAAPPDLGMAAMGDGLGRQGEVARRVPFVQQRPEAAAGAVFQ